MIDAVCLWDPVYRLQFIGLGRVRVGRGEVDYVRRKMLLTCVCFSLFLSCQRKLNYPCDGFGIHWPLCGLTCIAVCGGGVQVTPGLSWRFRVPQDIYIPSYGHPCPPDPAVLS